MANKKNRKSKKKNKAAKGPSKAETTKAPPKGTPKKSGNGSVCLRDGTIMKPFKEGPFSGHKCPDCGYFEGWVKPIPKKPRGVVLEDCPNCGVTKAFDAPDDDKMGVTCMACGYSAGRQLQRVQNDQLTVIDEEMASLRSQVNEALLKPIAK